MPQGLWRAWALALCALGMACSLAWPWGGQALGSLQMLCMAALVALLHHDAPSHGAAQGARYKRGFWRGWCFATVWLSATLWWLYVSLHTYGGLPAWLAALAVVLLTGSMALFYALACAAWLHGQKGLGSGWQALLFAALWTLAELCRGTLFTGFPWGAVGYAHVDSALAGFVPWLGVYGTGALAAWMAAWPVLALMQRSRTRRTAALAGVWAMLALLGWGLQHGASSAPPRPALTVALLQGNIAQEEKFQPNGGVQEALRWYGEQLLAARADLSVLPETALPLLPQDLPEGYWNALQQRFASGAQAALVGMPAGEPASGYANVAIGLAPAGGARTAGDASQQAALALPPAPQPLYTYAKHHLVPFGEFIPLGFGWFVRAMHIPLGDFVRGSLRQPRWQLGAERIAPHICYEDLFGEELAAQFRDPATAPTLLVNMSNIAWFGDTTAIDQHRHISRIRAKELHRPVLRATNTGATALIDANGHVVQELPRLTRGVLTGSVHGQDDITAYAWWASRLGLWPLWAAALATVALALALRGKAR